DTGPVTLALGCVRAVVTGQVEFVGVQERVGAVQFQFCVFVAQVPLERARVCLVVWVVEGCASECFHSRAYPFGGQVGDLSVVGVQSRHFPHGSGQEVGHGTQTCWKLLDVGGGRRWWMLAQVENPGVFLCRFVPASTGPLLGVCTRVEYDRVGLCTSVLRETIRMVFSFRSLFGTLSGRGGVAPVHVSL